MKFRGTLNVSQIGYMSELPLNILSQLILITRIAPLYLFLSTF